MYYKWGCTSNHQKKGTVLPKSTCIQQIPIWSPYLELSTATPDGINKSPLSQQSKFKVYREMHNQADQQKFLVILVTTATTARTGLYINNIIFIYTNRRSVPILRGFNDPSFGWPILCPWCPTSTQGHDNFTWRTAQSACHVTKHSAWLCPPISSRYAIRYENVYMSIYIYMRLYIGM